MQKPVGVVLVIEKGGFGHVCVLCEYGEQLELLLNSGREKIGNLLVTAIQTLLID
jgi:hypothetical protein